MWWPWNPSQRSLKVIGTDTGRSLSERSPEINPRFAITKIPSSPPPPLPLSPSAVPRPRPPPCAGTKGDIRLRASAVVNGAKKTAVASGTAAERHLTIILREFYWAFRRHFVVELLEFNWKSTWIVGRIKILSTFYCFWGDCELILVVDRVDNVELIIAVKCLVTVGWLMSTRVCLPASVAQWAEAQCAPTGLPEGGVQSPGRPVDFVFGFQGRMLWDYFSGRQRGFDGVLYNLWPLASIELIGAQLLTTA